MKFLTFPLVKHHLRLDDAQAEEERDVLEMYAEGAEETVLDIIRRTLANVVMTYDGVPARLKQAALLLTGIGYQQREPVSPTNFSAVPYGTVDILLKPLMRLAGDEPRDSDGLPQGMLFDSDGLALMDWQCRFLLSSLCVPAATLHDSERLTLMDCHCDYLAPKQ